MPLAIRFADMNYEICPCCGKPKRSRIKTGRFPANLLTDGSEAVRALFPVTTSGGGNGTRQELPNNCMSGKNYARITTDGQLPSSGSASRFFTCCPFDADDYAPIYYCGKATKRDRDEGLEGMQPVSVDSTSNGGSDGKLMTVGGASLAGERKAPLPRHNTWPTVKPAKLLQWLCRLITQPGGTVLDPFAGTGSTLKGAILEGFDCIGIEKEQEAYNIMALRVEHAKGQVVQMELSND